MTIDGSNIKERSFTNSDLNNEYIQYMKVSDSLLFIIDSIKAKIYDLNKKEFNTNNYIQSLQYRQYITELEERIPQAQYNWCLTHTKSFICFDFINTQLNNKEIDLNLLRNLYKNLDTILFKYPSYLKYKYILSKASYEVGDTIDDIWLLSLKGEKKNLLKNSQGKYIYVNFWDFENVTENKKNHENIKIFNESLKDKICFISICISNDTDRWKEYCKTNKLDWIQLLDTTGNESKLYRYFNIKYLPKEVLIDEKSVLINEDISISISERWLLFNKIRYEN